MTSMEKTKQNCVHFIFKVREVGESLIPGVPCVNTPSGGEPHEMVGCPAVGLESTESLAKEQLSSSK